MTLWLYLPEDALQELVTQKSATETALINGVAEFTEMDPGDVNVLRTDPELTEGGNLTEGGGRSLQARAASELGVFEVQLELVFAGSVEAEGLRESVLSRLQDAQLNTALTKHLSDLMTVSLADLTNNGTILAVLSGVDTYRSDDSDGSWGTNPGGPPTQVTPVTQVTVVSQQVDQLESGIWDKPEMYLASSGIALLGFTMIMLGIRFYSDQKANAVYPIVLSPKSKGGDEERVFERVNAFGIPKTLNLPGAPMDAPGLYVESPPRVRFDPRRIGINMSPQLRWQELLFHQPTR